MLNGPLTRRSYTQSQLHPTKGIKDIVSTVILGGSMDVLQTGIENEVKDGMHNENDKNINWSLCTP